MVEEVDEPFGRVPVAKVSVMEIYAQGVSEKGIRGLSRGGWMKQGPWMTWHGTERRRGDRARDGDLTWRMRFSSTVVDEIRTLGEDRSESLWGRRGGSCMVSAALHLAHLLEVAG